jgi:hypothetical protein
VLGASSFHLVLAMMTSSSSNGTIGASPPPLGVTPNFTNPESIGYQIVIAAVVCPVFAIAICLLRLYTARNIIKRFHPDDWLIFVALSFAIAYSIVNLLRESQ